MKKLLALFLAVFASAHSLEYKPWLGEVYEFHFLPKYAYSFYSSVEGSLQPLGSTSNDNLLYFGLEFPFTPEWSVDADLEFVDTPRQSFSFRSTALQLRYLWLDDIVGDSVSLTTGANIRVVSPRSLHDVSCPYYGNTDFQVNISIGKEYDQIEFWRLRLWGFGSVGIANRGSPWFEGKIGFDGNYDERHKWGIYVLGQHGFGRKNYVNIDHFHGYASIRNKFIDIGFFYGYKFRVYGTLKAEYDRRVLAKRCPQRVNTFIVSYSLPFSF